MRYCNPNVLKKNLLTSDHLFQQLDEEVEDILLQIADEFVENAINGACLLAKHRKNNKVEVKDVQLYLERNWNMWIPGTY